MLMCEPKRREKVGEGDDGLPNTSPPTLSPRLHTIILL